MVKKHVRSKPGLFGMTYYYDEKGKPLGKSRPGLIKGTRVYTDQNGRPTGKSRPGFLADEVFVNNDHEYITSCNNFLGKTHFKHGKPVGHSKPGLFGSSYTSFDIEDEVNTLEEFVDEMYELYEKEDTYVEHAPQKSTRVIFILLLFVICAIGICVYSAVSK